MMTCQEVCEHAQDYTDGHGSKVSRLRLRLHMLFCRNCTSFVDQTRQTKKLVRQSLTKKEDIVMDPNLMAEFRKKNE